jgi:hypothetical protein
VQDVSDYTFAQKADFTTSMKSELAKTSRSLNELEAKAESSSDAVKADAKLKLEALRDQATRFNGQLDEQVRTATESTWDTVKNERKKAYASMKEGLVQARQWISAEIAP